MACLACLLISMVPAAAQGEVAVVPATVTATLSPGEPQSVQITLSLPGSVPRGDVVFIFDTTGSMSNVLRTMQTQGIDVMGQIRNSIPDTRFGVASFMDYPKIYDNYYEYQCPDQNLGGLCMYGDPSVGDYAYKKDLDLTPDIGTASAAINGIPRGSGGDGPQDYARAIYESQFFSWDDGAKKIVVVFGDAAPHAAPNGTQLQKFWESGYVFTHTTNGAPYGGDPGRDEVPYTDDDLDYELVLNDVAARHIAIVGVYCPEDGSLDPGRSDAENNFKYMSYFTGGTFVLSNSGRDASMVAEQVVSIIQGMSTENVKEISVQVVEETYREWLTPPGVHIDVPWPSTEFFSMVITPPEGTPDGTYSFQLNVVGDGVVLGTVPVTITVVGEQVVDPQEVSLDIKPGSCPNSFNPREKGVLPAAILGSQELKASLIKPESIVLTRDGMEGGVKPLRWSLEDVGSPGTAECSCGMNPGQEDGEKDLTLKFSAEDLVKELGIEENDGCVKVTITGTIRSSDHVVPETVIIGSDYLRVLDTGHGSCGDGKDNKDKKCDKDGKDDKDNSCNTDSKGDRDNKGDSDSRGSHDGKDSGDGNGSCKEGGSCSGTDSRDGNRDQGRDNGRSRGA
jgi:hypothetical protein